MLWHIALYTVGTVLALRSLVSLMANHKRTCEEQLQRLARKNEKANRSSHSNGSEQDAATAVATKPSAA
ncbi:MAG: hypothetical protein KDA84_23310 [Planctomycetaceae bacterium]|nr:hypothetical protein [Planctomycetaceae bacterium]